jgi:hypothetical protein
MSDESNSSLQSDAHRQMARVRQLRRPMSPAEGTARPGGATSCAPWGACSPSAA